MVYKTVFPLLVLTVSKTVVAQQCSTKQSDGSGVPDQGRDAPDLQQVVTTKHSKGNHTSMVVAKQEDHNGFKCASINLHPKC